MLIPSHPPFSLVRLILLIAVLGAWLPSSITKAQEPYMVKDINSLQYESSSQPEHFCRVGATVFFIAFHPLHGRELWKTDGTTAGTVMVKDIFPGVQQSDPMSLVTLGGIVYFSAIDGVHGREIWKSDGTEAGTVMVKDINQASSGAHSVSTDSPITIIGNTLYFKAQDGLHGFELWKSDGSEAGTMMVKDIRPGSAGGMGGKITVAGGTMFFAAFPNENAGDELWKSDGTEAGTVLVKDIVPGSGYSSISEITSLGNSVYFRATTAAHGSELWKSDGTNAGTFMLREIAVGDSHPTLMTAFNNMIYFAANGNKLWKTDGTEAGTMLVKPPGGVQVYSGGFMVANNILYFAGGTTNNVELWKTDGTAAGTVQVKDIRPGFTGPDTSSNPFHLMTLNGVLHFMASDGVHGSQFWKSDGTDAGTVMVTDSFPQRHNNAPFVVDDTIYLSADDDLHGAELWKVGLAEGEPILLKDINQSTDNSTPTHFAQAGSTLYFQAGDHVNGRELWKSDGTAAGTVMVKDINPGASSSYPSPLAEIGETFFFIADNGINGFELWKSDGTPEGTIMVKDIKQGGGSTFPEHFTVMNDVLYFATNSDGLWRSDGTAQGTLMIKDIVAYHLTVINNTLYISAYDSATGFELWKSDGTPQNTTLVKDINPGSQSSDPHHLTPVGDTLFFIADDGANSRALWKSDGTTGGTTMVKDAHTGSDADFFQYVDLIPMNGALYFVTRPRSGVGELWKSDGTEAGTTIIKTLPTVRDFAEGLSLITTGDMLYFLASHSTNSTRLWKSDGTTDGTLLLKDVPSSYPKAVGNIVYFSTYSPATGSELWKSDGTEAGTVQDILNGSGSTISEGFGVAGNRLFFAATTPTHKCELWAMPVTITPPVVATGSASPLGESSATLNGTIKAAGFSTSAKFVYGPTTSYGSTAKTWLNPNNSFEPIKVSANISGLQPNSTYYYRLVADNFGNTVEGAEGTFTTLPFNPPPSGGTLAPSPGTQRNPGSQINVSFAGWTDDTTPTNSLRYQVLVDGHPPTAISSVTTYNYTAPNTPGATINIKGRIYDAADKMTEVATYYKVNTGLETWRNLHFGIPTSTGDAANDLDFDHDGIPNLLEWATNSNPKQSNVLPVVFTPPLGTFGSPMLTYTRLKAAVTGGAIYTAQWSETLAPGSWTNITATHQIFSDNGTVQQVRVSLPQGNIGRRFYRLRVTAP